MVSKTGLNPGLGRKFYFFGKFRSLILARRSEKKHPGSFIVTRIHGYPMPTKYYYVLKEKARVRKNPGRLPVPKITRYSKFRVNPKHGILIYGRVLKIYAQKTSGPYKGQRFVHSFKRGAIMLGMPDGSLRIMHP